MAETALELADAVRRGEKLVGPSLLWAAADREASSRGERVELYSHALIHAGFLVSKDVGTSYAVCPRCEADLT